MRKRQPQNDPAAPPRPPSPAGSSVSAPPPAPGLRLDAHAGPIPRGPLGPGQLCPCPWGLADKQAKISQGQSQVPGRTGGSWGKPTQESLLINLPQACAASVSTNPGRTVREGASAPSRGGSSAPSNVRPNVRLLNKKQKGIRN